MKLIQKMALEECPKLNYIKPQVAPIDELCTAYEAGFRACREMAAAKAKKMRGLKPYSTPEEIQFMLETLGELEVQEDPPTE